jgi:hypothetical protein
LWLGDSAEQGLAGVPSGRSKPVNVKKIVTIAIVALLVFYLITQPLQSAAAVQTVLSWLREGAEAIITFVKSLFA